MKLRREPLSKPADALPASFVSILDEKGLTVREVCFFDIETTGLSPKSAMIYLIGAVVYEEDGWLLYQFFAEKEAEETAVLHAFCDLIASKKLLVHFNGERFDLPFVAARCRMHDIALSVPSGLDLYRQIAPYKSALSLPNCSLKRIERFLGIQRTDLYTGGELIGVYKDYLSDPEEEKEALLLLHNADDLRGTFALLQILAYPAFLKQIASGDIAFCREDWTLQPYTDYEGKESEELFVTVSFQDPLPAPFRTMKDGVVFRYEKGTGLLRVPVFTGELKHFLEDYRSYYYLPVEDTAVHKSVGEFVDRAFRKQATKATAYLRREGRFLPVWNMEHVAQFQAERKDRQRYIEITEALNASVSMQSEYVLQLLQWLFTAPASRSKSSRVS